MEKALDRHRAIQSTLRRLSVSDVGPELPQSATYATLKAFRTVWTPILYPRCCRPGLFGSPLLELKPLGELWYNEQIAESLGQVDLLPAKVPGQEL